MPEQAPTGQIDPKNEVPVKTPSAASDRVLEAAVDLFAQRGFAAATIRDITAACGLTSAAFYYHFTSKEGLLYQIILDNVTGLFEIIDALPLADAQPPVALDLYVREVARFTLAHSKTIQVANRDFRALRGAELEHVIENRQRTRAALEQILDRDVRTKGLLAGPGKAAGSPEMFNETRILADAILNLIADIAGWYRPDGALSVDDAAEVCSRLAMRMAGFGADVA